jgi:hypothetical protein
MMKFILEFCIYFYDVKVIQLRLNEKFLLKLCFHSILTDDGFEYSF